MYDPTDGWCAGRASSDGLCVARAARRRPRPHHGVIETRRDELTRGEVRHILRRRTSLASIRPGRPAGTRAGARVVPDGGDGAIPPGRLDAWLVTDQQSELIAHIRRLARARGLVVTPCALMWNLSPQFVGYGMFVHLTE